VPREPLDAVENLPKEAPRQVAFGELQGEVPGMSDELRAGLEEPLLEARQGPALDGDGQDEPPQQIAEVVGDHPEEQPHLVGPSALWTLAGRSLAARQSPIHLSKRKSGFRTTVNRMPALGRASYGAVQKRYIQPWRKPVILRALSRSLRTAQKEMFRTRWPATL
jgi:hypothetical protein